MTDLPDPTDSKKKIDPKPQNRLDDALQRELDEALGSMSIDELVDAASGKGARSGPAGLRSGRVVSIHGEDVFVDLGGRSEGVLPLTQFTEVPRVGDMVQVTIEGYNDSEGLLMLSREGAIQAAAWETLAEGQVVEGRVTGINKGGVELSVNNIRAFMPLSHVALFRVDDQYVTGLLNQKLRVQVVEVDPEDKRLIVSRKAVLEVEAAEAREKAFGELVEGKTLTGTVKTIMPYGAFVDIGGVDGLLHVKDMSHARVEDPRQIVSEGQKLELMVLKVDRETRKIALGLKQVLPDPWADAAAKWPVDSLVSGTIKRLADFGAFVELEPGVEALVPISEMTFERRIKHPSELLKEGDVTRARVMAVDPSRKRISLSIKRVGDDPWMGASARWPVDTVVSGIVKRITDFGAFVEITPGVEGLVHISEISDQRIRSVKDALGEGQSVQAKVLEVDEERRRISLSIKAVVSSADYTGQAAEAAQPSKPAPKRKKPLRGGLD
jgi:small subunit ribosomal protein S1